MSSLNETPQWIEPRPTRLVMPIDPGRDHIVGHAGAPVMLLEYGDYECPDCGRAYPKLNVLRERLGDRLAFAFRHFPQFTIHRHASIAAQAAEAAHAQGKFWAMHDLLYRNQDRMDVPDLTHYALRAGLEVYRFEQSLTSGIYTHRVEEDFETGRQSGVRGTPTLFINGERYVGAVEVDALVEAIERASSA